MYSLSTVFFYGVSENSSLVSGFKDLKWSITVMLKQCECHSSESLASDIILIVPLRPPHLWNTRVVVRIFNRWKNTCNRRQVLEAACGFGSCVSSFQDSSAGNFFGIAGDFFRLPAFIYIPEHTT